MTKYKPEQKPVKEGVLRNGARWQIYEEFGCYGVYVGGRLKSVHDTLGYALGRIARFESGGFSR